MSKYIPFTTEQKERAASVDLEEFLRRRGEKLITSGRDKRLASDHSITIRGCEWYDHATEQGGRAISFVKQFYGLSYVWHTSMLSGSRRAAIIARSLSESFSQKVGLTARNSYVPLSYSRCSSSECRTHCSTAESFANM